MSDLIISAIKKYALVCSVTHKRGKFTRTGQDFIDEICAEVESVVRELNAKVPLTLDAAPTEDAFVTGAMAEKLKMAMNGIVARIVQNAVARQPTCGKTLSRTR